MSKCPGMQNNINIGRKVLSDSEIEKHKDFASLYRSYQTIHTPLYKTTRFITGISVAAAAMVLFVLYFSFFRNSTSTNPLNGTDQVTLAIDKNLLPHKVSPPLAGFEVPRQSFRMKGNKGASFKTASGTEIIVPAEAFVDKEGIKINDEVEIRYREFNNPLEFFLSGIPMHQVTGGQMVRTESAGMFEILAFRNNQAVSLDKNKVIEVELISAITGDFDCLHLEAGTQQWANLGESPLIAENGQAVPSEFRKSNAIDSAGLPAVPRKADKKKIVFNIQVDVSDFPELSEYEGLLFEVNETYGKFDERLYDNTWEKAILKPSNVPSNYDLTLSIRDTSVTITVYPVFNSKNYDEAVKLYQEKKEVWLARQKDNSKNSADNNGLAKGDMNADAPDLSGQPALAFREMKPVGKRHFEVAKLGIYQSGRQLGSEGLTNIRPVIVDINGNEVPNATFYLAERNYNTLSGFGQSQVISFRNSAQNLFWALTPDGKIGVLAPESFAILTKESDTPRFKMVFVEPQTGIALIKNALQI